MSHPRLQSRSAESSQVLTLSLLPESSLRRPSLLPDQTRLSPTLSSSSRSPCSSWMCCVCGSSPCSGHRPRCRTRPNTCTGSAVRSSSVTTWCLGGSKGTRPHPPAVCAHLVQVTPPPPPLLLPESPNRHPPDSLRPLRSSPSPPCHSPPLMSYRSRGDVNSSERSRMWTGQKTTSYLSTDGRIRRPEPQTLSERRRHRCGSGHLWR